MLRALIPPIFRSTRLCYNLWYNAPTMLPAGSLEAVAGNIVSALYHKL